MENTNKLTVAKLRDLEKQVGLGEISYSRMVEVINEHFSIKKQKTSNKVYLCQTSSGSYVDARSWIDSVWNDPAKAEQRKLKIDAEYAEMREMENPIGHTDYNIMTDPEYAVFEKWQQDKYDAEEYNGTTVLELELK